MVTVAAMKEHGLPHDQVNVGGGACPLEHPIGASGVPRNVVTLIGALREYGFEARRGEPVHWRGRSHGPMTLECP